ncbi:hypothetical protein SUGI_0977260 [Cryptomeria japonica]|nr:hypothetical protein SUGI_0977260 [Cryptomeria japonica]
MDRLLKGARASGSLNLSNRALKEVPHQIYNNLDAIGEGEKWWEAVELQKLILAHNSIQTISEDLGNLSFLTVLNVSHNQLSYLPAAVGRLTMLKMIDVSSNLLCEIPEEIGSATALVILNCASNQLTSLPISLGKCIELTELKASNNHLTALPGELVHCSKLVNLDLQGNKITVLPDHLLCSWTILKEINAANNNLTEISGSIGKLSRLIRLDLHQNRIPSIPSAFAGCSSLAELYLGNNLLSSIPVEFGALSSLGTLDLHSNQLTEYPEEACKLQLSVLDLSNNYLTGLPPQLGKMTSLRKLLLVGNPLRTIRSSLVLGPTQKLLEYLRSRLPTDEEAKSNIASSSNLFGVDNNDCIAIASRQALSSKALLISGLGLESIPSAAWELGELVMLDVCKNGIKELPNELSMCTSLETLLLSDNRIENWPGAVVASLPNLQCLKLDKNPLAQLPQGAFVAVSRLKILDLSGISGPLPEPPALSDMPELQELYLRRMHLKEVPFDLKNLRQLRILDLSQNSLSEIPESFQQLTCLEELDLSDNNITMLPPELGRLDLCLRSLRLDGNPLRSIRRTIVVRGTKAVLKYLKDKIDEA